MIQSSKGKNGVAQRGPAIISRPSMRDLTMETAMDMVGKSEAPTDLAGTYSIM